jgi:hypothetical protein
MRALPLLALLYVAPLGFADGGCMPSDSPDPDWMKPPKSYQTKTADLTFNESGLKAFNMLKEEERDAFVENLKASAGTFKGQAIFKSGAGLGDAMENAKYGSYELAASTEDVLFEITIDYYIFTTEEVGKPIAPQKAIEFTGTLVELDFQDEDKPRLLTAKVQADQITVLKD